MIKNPNEIVESFVADYQKAFGDTLLSVIMYGSAVTHEFRPGKSDITMAIVLTDTSIGNLGRSVEMHRKWRKRGVATPFFMSKEFIATSRDTYSIEFLDMKSNYRILYGEDVLAGIETQRDFLRTQCERELKDIALLLRKTYVDCLGQAAYLAGVLDGSVRQMIPIFRAILLLAGKNIPSTNSDIIAAVEDEHNLGISALSDIFHCDRKHQPTRQVEIFRNYVDIIDLLTKRVCIAGSV
jgi:hypothetical protein